MNARTVMASIILAQGASAATGLMPTNAIITVISDADGMDWAGGRCIIALDNGDNELAPLDRRI